MQPINWYPGHMARARRLLEAQVRGADAIIELCDARAPRATRNPDLTAIARGKARALVLNKADLANETATRQWIERFAREGLNAVKFNAAGGRAKDVFGVIEALARPTVERMKARGANKTVRMMVVGIPNVGKSTFINKLRGQAVTVTGDRPGVTRANQWVKVGPYLELLDTPGMLWPKLDNQEYARALAYLGSIRDEIMDSEELAGSLLEALIRVAPEETRARFKLPEEKDEALTLLEATCKGRGWLLSGGRFDTARAAAVILDEFRAGKLGRITLERA